MKLFLMGTPQKAFSEDLFAILAFRYKGLNMQTASNSGEMASMLKSEIYDLAIVNSDRDALDLSIEIVAAGLSVPILVYSETSYIPLIKKLYGAGISGVLNVGDGDKEILKAIADVLAKRIYISESVKQQLLNTMPNTVEYLNEDKGEAFKNNSLNLSHIERNVAFTYLGESTSVFTYCLN